MQKEVSALDMSQEAHAEAMAVTSAFNEAGDVRHNKGTKVAMFDHPKVWHQGRERIIGNLGSSGGDT